MTDERIKEYYKDDDIEDLAHLHISTRERAKKQNTTRILLTCFGFFIVYYIILCTLFYILDHSFTAFLVPIIPSAISAFFHFVIHWSIYNWLISKDIESDDYIKSIENRIRHAEDNIKAMTGVEMAELFAKRLWHYTDQFCNSANISKPHDAAVIWASLLYYAHKVLDERKLTPLVKRRFKYTAPFLYARSFNAPDDCQAILHTMEDTLQSLLDNQISLERKQECEEFLTMHNISYFDQISAYLDALYNTKRYIRVILDVREHRNDGPQFPGPIPG